MKVEITERSRCCITLAEEAAAKRVIKELKEEAPAASYADLVIKALGERPIKVYEATAEIVTNSNILNAICDNSGKLDVWIEAEAMIEAGFILMGIYLSDIWQITGDPELDQHIFNKMYYKKYIEL